MEDGMKNLKPENVFRFFEEICTIPHPSGYPEKIVSYLESFAQDRGLPFFVDGAGNVVIYKGASLDRTVDRLSDCGAVREGAAASPETAAARPSDPSDLSAEDAQPSDVAEDARPSDSVDMSAEDAPEPDNKSAADNLPRFSNPVILQAHLDMVSAAEEYSNMDFRKDPVRTFVDGDLVRTFGTTLGADDGIGVAMILAVLDDDTLSHPAIEAVFTSDEEVGMLGALAFDFSKINGKRLINIDSEIEGELVCGCSGGVDMHVSLPVAREERSGMVLEIGVRGLVGGHSGLDIHRGRASANTLMIRVLSELLDTVGYSLIDFAGGVKDSAISTLCTARISVFPTEVEKARDALLTIERNLKTEYGELEPSLDVFCSEAGFEIGSALTGSSLSRALRLLSVVSTGLFDRIPYLPDVVQTSANMGVLRLGDDRLRFVVFVRSSVESSMRWQKRRLINAAELAGGSVFMDSEHPAWVYKAGSPLQETFKSVYKSLYGTDLKVTAVHAGLECGIFSDNIENLDVVSLGPDVKGAHSPYETLSVSSTERVYRLLCESLAKLE